MKVYISVINHNHDDIITGSETLRSLAQEHTVVIRSNTPPTKHLDTYCKNGAIHLITSQSTMGFAANNNAVFEYCTVKVDMSEHDYFLVLNPDVEIKNASLNELLIQAKEYQSDISTINLYRDPGFTTFDNSIRHYPKLLSPLKSLLGVKREDIYDKSQINSPLKIQWAAGSFLLFRATTYQQLGGFDDSYFMYFEDVDICTRANINNFSIYYFPKVKALHHASHQNKNIFSKHFYWYCKSSVKYQLKFQFGRLQKLKKRKL